MKKICFSFFCAVLLVVSSTVGAMIAEAASTKYVSGFWRSDFEKGVGYEGPMHLSTKGYSHSTYEDATVSEFCIALYRDNVVFIHTHGNPGYFFLSPTVHVSASVLSEYSMPANSKLVYISACYAALTSSESGNVCTALRNKGVQTVVAFKDSLTASSSSDGIHRYNSLVVYRLVCGDTISDAMESALEQFLNEQTVEGRTWGADSYNIYGNLYTTIY